MSTPTIRAVFLTTTDNVSIAPDGGTAFDVKSIPRIGESIRVKNRRYRINDVEHELGLPSGGHNISLIVESEREIGDVI